MRTEHITYLEELEEIINECNICHIAMVDERNNPYVLPFNFGYEKGIIYLHSGNDGRKIHIFQHNPSVCIAFTIEKELYHQSPQIACSYGMKFKSVLAYGEIEQVKDFDEKTQILHKIMHKYTENKEYTFGKAAIENVACFKVEIKKMTGRKRIS